jgi:hypothetical protein
MFERAPADGASGLSERLGHTPLAFTMRPQGGEHAPRREPLQLGCEQRANATRSRRPRSMKRTRPLRHAFVPATQRSVLSAPRWSAHRATVHSTPRQCRARRACDKWNEPTRRDAGKVGCGIHGLARGA